MPGVFTAAFPSEPRKETKTAAAKTTIDYFAWNDRDAYTLHVSDDPVFANVPDDDALARVLEGAMQAKVAAYGTDQGGTPLQSRSVRVAGTTGRESSIAVERPMKGTNWVRLVIVGGRYYDLTVFVASDSKRDEHERFFASFKPSAAPQ